MSVNVNGASSSYEVSTEVVSEDCYQIVFNGMADGVVLISLTGKIHLVNTAFCDLVGYKQNELLETSIEQYLQISPTNCLKDIRYQLFQSKKATVENFIIHRDKTTLIPVEINLTQYVQNNEIFILANIRNITLRHSTTTQLDLHQYRYHSLFVESPDLIYALDVKTLKIIDCNKTFLTVLGYEQDEVIGHCIYEFYDNCSVPDAQNALIKYLRDGDPFEAERILVAKDGSRVPTWIKCPWTEVGKYNFLFVVLRDITNRKIIEKQLSESELKYRDLYNKSPDMILSVSAPDGLISDVNHTMIETTGYSADEIIGKHFSYIYTDDSAERAFKLFELFNTKHVEDHNFERTVVCKNGEEIQCHVRTTQIFDANENFVELRVVYRDISAQYQLRKKMKRLEHEHQRKLEHVARVSTMGEMATSLAHELNQPLSAINNYLHGCIRRINQDKLDKGMIKKIMQQVINESLRASEIIKWLREFIKNKKYNPQSISVKDECKSAINFVKLRNKYLLVNINYHQKSDMPNIVFDKIQLQQLLINLLSNAIEAVDQVGKKKVDIKIFASHDEDWVNLLISDNGPGISPEKQKNLFVPFFTTKDEGMGMGLAICRSIVTSQGGLLDLYHSDQNGTVFTIKLPHGHDHI